MEKQAKRDREVNSVASRRKGEASSPTTAATGDLDTAKGRKESVVPPRVLGMQFGNRRLEQSLQNRTGLLGHLLL
jgi:hypothetical protein